MAKDESPTAVISAAETSDPIPGGFRRRLIIAICLLFLVTMGVFLTASFSSEKDLHYRSTFAHLDETLGILSMQLGGSQSIPPQVFTDLETRLEERSGVSHRVIYVDSELTVLGSSDPQIVGRNMKKVYRTQRYQTASSNWIIATRGDAAWLASSVPVPSPDVADGRVFLMRLRRGSERFVGQFVGLHGTHIVVTLLLFGVVLYAFGVRYVRRPIEQLAAHVREVEAGEFVPSRPVPRDDEIGWLARRFTHMGTTLRDTIQRLVRAEKHASVSVVAFRIAREMSEPLEALKRHILYIDGLAEKDAEIRAVSESLRKDRQNLVDVIGRLNEIQPPEENAA